MKKRALPFHDALLVAMSTIFLISLCGAVAFSFYNKYQKRKLNDLISQKINNDEREILILKKQLAELKTKANRPYQENLIINNNKFTPITLDGTNLLSSMNFENKVKDFLAQFEHQAAIKKIVLPSNFFSEFERKIFYSKNIEKEIEQKQKQLVLIKNILEKIVLFPKLKIEKFELRNETDHDCSDKRTLLLGTLFISITTRENYFQTIFNTIINSKYFFIISSITISNSNPLPPLHHDVYSKDHLLPILGSETITASLRIDLFDRVSAEQLSSNASSKLAWKHQKNASPLFVSRYYATKNEQLLDPLDNPQMLCPPVPNEWLVNNNLDYSKPNILFEDSDKTGFSNLEKWLGDNPQEEPGKFSSDPNDPISHPLLWTKLKCYQKDMTSEVYNIYFLGFDSNKKGTLFQIQPETVLQSKNRHGKVIFDKKIRFLKMGEQIEGLPYNIVNYQEKQIIYKKTSYDCSELIIENLNNREQVTLIKKSPYHPQPTQLTNITSIKIENTLFNPSRIIALKLGDYFSLDYVLPNCELADKQNIIETENYRLIEINNKELTIEKGANHYKIPIISTTK